MIEKRQHGGSVIDRVLPSTLRPLRRRLITALAVVGALGGIVAVIEVAFVRELSGVPNLGAFMRLESGALALAAFILARIILGTAVGGIEERFSASLENDLRLHLVRRLLAGSPFGRLTITRDTLPDELINDTRIAVGLLFSFVNAVIREPIRLIGFASALAGAGLPLLVFLVIVGSILGTLTRWIGGALGAAFERQHQRNLEVLMTLREVAERQATWMSCGQSGALGERLTRELRTATRASFTSSRLTTLLRMSLRLGYYGAVLGGTWVATRLVGAHDSLGHVASLGVAAAWLQAPIASLVELRRVVLEARPSFRRVREIDTMPALEPKNGDSVPLARIERGIRVRNVSFSYPGGRLALQDVSFECACGARLGIAGSSGSGKSTLIRLIARLIKPQHGTISFDDVVLPTADETDLRRVVGVLLQPPALIRGTLRDNLTLGAGVVSDDRLQEALNALLLDRFVAALPKGLTTPLGDTGEQVSSGQRTRIALARLLLKEPQIVLLDEPTSFLDPETGLAVIERLSRFLRERTALVVSNDPRVLALCDRVLRLSAGRIDEA